MSNSIKILGMTILVALVVSSCATVDMEASRMSEIAMQNKRLAEQQITVNPVDEKRYTEKTDNIVDVEPVFITVKEPVYVPSPEAAASPVVPKKDLEAVTDSLSQAREVPQNYVGGTTIYDFDENKQFYVYTKLLGMTIIQLEPGETATGRPYLSDGKRWEVAGDIWTKNGVDTQLIMLKPMEVGLVTNMLVITNKRLYQFQLVSTNKDYMPMIRFRYPYDQEFITSATKKEQIKQEIKAAGTPARLLSYNYTITTSLFKPEWVPVEVYDDGQKTYIRLPRITLQKEFPAVYDEKKYIVNYRVVDDLVILDKLVDRCTLKLGWKWVRITKKKGPAIDMAQFEQKPIESYTPVKEEIKVDTADGKYKIRYNNFKPPFWMPLKVYDDGLRTYVLFPNGIFGKDKMPTMIDGKSESLEFALENDNLAAIDALPDQIRVAYNGEYIDIEKKKE